MSGYTVEPLPGIVLHNVDEGDPRHPPRPSRISSLSSFHTEQPIELTAKFVIQAMKDALIQDCMLWK